MDSSRRSFSKIFSVKNLSKLVAASSILLFALSGRVRGECTVAKPAKKWNGVPIGLIADAGVPAGVIEKAVDYWAACETYGKGFPPFVTTPLDERSTAPRLEVTLVRYSQSERCATFHGRTIILYAFARHRTGKPILCGSLAQNLAHELGHFLGLKHAAKAADCKLDIMSTVKQVNSRRRRVTEGECRAVDSRWLAADERPPEGPLGERALARLEEP